MRRRSVWLACVAGLAAIAIAGCGGSSSKSSSGSASSASSASSGTPVKGGTATILEAGGGVDSLDPGYWYYQTDTEDLGQTTQRTLYGWTATGTTPTPDLATGLPKLSGGGKTLTIHIRPGIHYSPPLASKTVTTADIKYAMERCFLASVGNGYANSYYGGIVGAPSTPTTKLKTISGITAPNPTTLVIKTTAPVGVLTTANALSMNCTVPVPQSYASKYDKGSTSTYGNHQVFTGPYMIKGAGSGTVPSSSYSSGRYLYLVRNPSFDAATDSLNKGYINAFVFKGGNDVTVASRQTLTGSDMFSGDFAAPPVSVLQQGLTSSQKVQFHVLPSGGLRYIALNTAVKPLDNVNFRRAIAAVTNRTALRLTRGGPAVGTIATHYIPPGVPGFQQAGGSSTTYDFLTNPNGNLKVAEAYMKKAGYPSGKYTGPPLLTIADNQAPASNTAQAFESQVAALGIKLNFREVPHAAVISKFCGTPKSKVAICPTLGWGKDFNDAQSMIDPILNGKNIVQSGNVNVAQANNPVFNKQMNAAEAIATVSQRAQAWGGIDKAITAQAYLIPWLWDNEVTFASKNVHGVNNANNGNAWNLAESWLTNG